ncbi:MAG: DUF2142 domain-containing protein, partial [Lachnospiraceae bacterium]|nr:DUF2142 domain-containing protein [Lachnospiraceae bacterium]
GILGILLLAAATLLYYAIVIKRLRVEQLFVAMALPFGVIFSLVIALYTVPDEPSHIDTAYAISNELLGIEESEKPGYIYKRACDADMNTEEKQSLSADSWERLYSQLFTLADDTTLVECAARSNLNNAGKLYYLPQALGITAGRLLGLGMMPTMMLGRLMHVLCYMLLVYFAIRKLPVATTSMLLIACLPITLQQAASFSYDGMINAISFLFVSYCVYALYGEKLLGVRDFLVIALTGCLLASVKGGVYVPLCLLPLAVFFRKDRVHQAQRKYFAALTLLFVFAFAKGNLASLMSRLLAAQGTRSGGASGSEVYTMGYLLNNPLHALGLFVNTFYKQWDSYLRNLLGGNLAWREINIKWTVVFATLLILLLSCLRSEKEPSPGRLEKGYTGFLCLGCYCCIELSMLLAWTPVTYTYITGVQGRYFLPFFFLILFLLRNSLVSLKRNIDRQLIFAAGMVNIITILQVVQLVLD